MHFLQIFYFLSVLFSILQVIQTVKYYGMEYAKEESNSKHKLEYLIEIAFFSTQGAAQIYFMYFMTYCWEEAVGFLELTKIMNSISSTDVDTLDKVSLNSHLPFMLIYVFTTTANKSLLRSSQLFCRQKSHISI